MARKRTTLYDLLRDGAKSVRSQAANVPDAAFQKAMETGQNFTTVHCAKVLITGFMQGKMDAADFATALAENDKLRSTVSDLCRLRLEIPDYDVERNDKRFDVVAGVKTFWSEMRVPVPSELEAARDARNIAIGVMAGREGKAYNGPKKKTLKEALQDAKRTAGRIVEDTKKKAAQFAVDKLTPIAEEDTRIDTRSFLPEEDAAAFLKTEEGKVYQNAYTKCGAEEIKALVESLDQSKTEASGFSKDDLIEPLELASFYDLAVQISEQEALPYFDEADLEQMQAEAEVLNIPETTDSPEALSMPEELFIPEIPDAPEPLSVPKSSFVPETMDGPEDPNRWDQLFAQSVNEIPADEDSELSM